VGNQVFGFLQRRNIVEGRLKGFFGGSMSELGVSQLMLVKEPSKLLG